MKATIYFLVRVEDSYNNFVEMDNGEKLSINNSIDDVETINRVGKVIDAPKGAIVEEGDFLLFHHNICRQSWGLKSKKRPSVFSISPNIFFIPVTEVFMYMKKGEDKWNAVDPFVFIEPIPASSYTLPNGIEIQEESYYGMKPLVGKVAYPNEQLKSVGVKEGDIIAFQQDSEHRYDLKGNLYYKMRTQDILAIL